MYSDDRPVDRRSVLRATGAAVSGLAVVAGPAAGGHVSIGDCVEVTADTGFYQDACPTDGLLGTVQRGEGGSVGNTCTDADGEEWVYFNSRENRDHQGWVFGDYVEPC